MRKRCMWIFIAFAALVSCSGSKKGESCEDEGRVAGDCESGLMCARAKADDTSPLVCLTPCDTTTQCEANEVCSGERGRNLQACRAK